VFFSWLEWAKVEPQIHPSNRTYTIAYDHSINPKSESRLKHHQKPRDGQLFLVLLGDIGRSSPAGRIPNFASIAIIRLTGSSVYAYVIPANKNPLFTTLLAVLRALFKFPIPVSKAKQLRGLKAS
jgi:hypothetical protein